ncbi:MAG: hypothetical protein ABUK01_02405 [Leptospirales bacterium]
MRINFIEKLKTDRLFLLRFIMVLVCLDTISVMVLARVSPIQFINVAKFLSIPAPDTRELVTLYYPKSIRINEDKDASPENLKVGSDEKIIRYTSSELNDNLAVENAKIILIGLANDPKNPEGRKVFNYDDIPERIWFNEHVLYISIHEEFVKFLKNTEWKIVSLCIKKSLTENIDSVHDVVFMFR